MLEVDGLCYQGVNLMASAPDVSPEVNADKVDEGLSRLEGHLGQVNSVPSLAARSDAVYNSASDLADVMSGLAVNRAASQQADARAAQVNAMLDGLAVSDSASTAATETLRQALQAQDEAELGRLWAEPETLGVV